MKKETVIYEINRPIKSGDELNIKTELEKYRGRDIELDMIGCHFVVSGFISMLLSLQKDFLKCGNKITIVNPEPDVRNLLQVTNLGKQFGVW